MNKAEMKKEFMSGYPEWKLKNPNGNEGLYAREFMKKHVQSKYYIRALADLKKKMNEINVK